MQMLKRKEDNNAFVPIRPVNSPLGIFAGRMENNWVTGLTLIGSAVIWSTISIFGIKILAKKYINANITLGSMHKNNVRTDSLFIIS